MNKPQNPVGSWVALNKDHPDVVRALQIESKLFAESNGERGFALRLLEAALVLEHEKKETGAWWCKVLLVNNQSVWMPDSWFFKLSKDELSAVLSHLTALAIRGQPAMQQLQYLGQQMNLKFLPDDQENIHPDEQARKVDFSETDPLWWRGKHY